MTTDGLPADATSGERPGSARPDGPGRAGGPGRPRPAPTGTPLLDREAAAAARRARAREADDPLLLDGEPAEADGAPAPGGILNLSFRTRLTVALIAAAVLPLAGFGLVLVVAGLSAEQTVLRLLLLSIAAAALLGLLIAYLIAADLTSPIRAMAAAVERVAAGEPSEGVRVAGEDELARLAESHNRLAADTHRRNRELADILAAVGAWSPRDGASWLAGRAAADARQVFELIDAEVLLVDPASVPELERVPGEPRPVRADVRAGEERLGLLVGRLPATRTWEAADQDLLELFASEVGVALRNAELFARVEAQNAQLLALDAAKDEFLRGVSHNLQTPLTSIRLYAAQLAGQQPDRRLSIIAEQSERLSRMVRQLLTVSRLESGVTLRSESEVIALAPRVRRAWEALAATDVPFRLDDRSAGWLAVADPDQLDQVLWALLDNAVKYGERRAVTVEVALEAGTGRLRLTVADAGPGIPDADRGRLFARYSRGSGRSGEDGSGLGLYVSRELARAMGGDLVLEAASPGRGASFSVYLPAEAPDEA
ncbi:MAG TPA: ATP-binding protein [Candidatus Limnocylindrales bacterium]